MNLKDELYNCLPSGRLAFTALLRLLDVVETDRIPTAAVECKDLPRLLINPQFIAQHAQTPEKLCMLVLHELHHVLLGHTRRFKLISKADNFVFDCVINAMLCRLLPEREYTSLFTDFYRADKFPECFLRPPDGWSPYTHDDCDMPPALKKRFPGVTHARAVYRALYSHEGVTYEDIRSLIERPATVGGSPLIGEGILDALQGRLLGHHAGDEEGADGLPNPAQQAPPFVDAVLDVIRQWPDPPTPIKGQSLYGMLTESRIHVKAVHHDRQCLRQLITSVADLKGAPSRGEVSLRNLPVQSPVRASRLSRKDKVFSALGHQTLLFDTRIPQPVPGRQVDRVHVYLDVSGSIESIKDVLYGVVLDQQDYLHTQVHLFSTEVHSISLKQLAAGLCKTTGGTDINCVFSHARQHKVKRALVVTDGYVGDLSAINAKYVKGMRIAVAYTPAYCRREMDAYTYKSGVLRLGSRELRS